MTLVMRYLLVSRLEKEANNDLKSSFLGSDSPSGLYKMMEPPKSWCTLTTSFSLWCSYLADILCRLGAMPAFKESDLRSAKRFPSQQKDSEAVK